MENNSYVYIYTRLDNNTIFYVGKGKDNRYKGMNSRNNHFMGIINKVPYKVEFLYTDLTDDQALDLEKKTIHYLVFEENYGIDIKGYEKPNEIKHLCNQTWGGEGCSGHNPYENFTDEQMELVREKMRKNHIIKIVLLNTLEVFSSMSEGAEKYNCDLNSVSQCCNGIYKTGGKDKNGIPLIWKKYEDYLKMTQEEIDEVIRNVDSRIILLNTLEIFNSMKEGAKKYNVEDNNISRCCNGNRKSCGKLSDGTKLVWMFYQDYLKMTQEEVDNKIKKVQEYKPKRNGGNNPNSKAVINITEMKIFSSMKEGAKKYGIKNSSDIGQCCKGRLKSCGKLSDGTPLVWRKLVYKHDIVLRGSDISKLHIKRKVA